MGVIASHLAQRYGRPAIALAMDEHRGTGSGRSIPIFNLLEALRACQELLVRFGGHAQACGLTVERKHLDSFRALVNDRARSVLGQEGLVRSRSVDLELPLKDVTRQWVEELERLAPYGFGNPRPTVVIRRLGIEPQSPRRATLFDGTLRLVARGRFEGLRSSERYDVVANPTLMAGEPALSVSDVKGSVAPSGHDRISGTRNTHVPA
jgi:hypothetical protein